MFKSETAPSILGAKVLSTLAGWRLKKRATAKYVRNWQDYGAWRDAELRSQYIGAFSMDLIKGKDVIDFGCGNGALSLLVAENGVRSVVGYDVQQIGMMEDRELPNNVSFHCAQSITTIEAPDQRFDVLLCFDVLEHIMNYDIVIREWRQILP